MPAAQSSNVDLVGGQLPQLTLSASAQEYAFTMVNRLNGQVQLIAYDSSGNAVSFLYASSSSGTFNRAPAGGGLTLPIYKAQSWFFKQDQIAGASLHPQCVA
jgi:hypothetical protein